MNNGKTVVNRNPFLVSKILIILAKNGILYLYTPIIQLLSILLLLILYICVFVFVIFILFTLPIFWILLLSSISI
jgi:hypothetical protein